MLKTGPVEFKHCTGYRHISWEALRDLPGRYGYRNGVTGDADERLLLSIYSDVIDRVAKRYPDTFLTNVHF